MFREMQRKNKQLTKEECIELLVTENRGVLSVLGDGGYPYGMPMNHFYNCDDGRIYFHCGRSGHRFDALINNSKVSFCVYDKGFRIEGEWALNVKSVIVFGTVEILDDPDIIASISAKLSRKFTQDEEYIRNEIERFADNTFLLRLTPEHICGKLVKEA